MFGYVRPYVSELKVKEFEQFRSCYCSLCHALGKQYGVPARMILNYDFTLLAMLLWSGEGEICRRRCLIRLGRKTCCYRQDASLGKAAGFSVILFWWKLKDNFSDRGILEKLKAVGIMPFMYLSYRKAREDYPVFDEQVRNSLSELRKMEQSEETSLDKMADCFAMLLAGAGSDSSSRKRERILTQQFYHLGRWIYLVDAANDLKKDQKRGDYNVIAAHFSLGHGQEITPEQKEEIRATITQSSNLCITSFELMDSTIWTSIISNILYFGLPNVCNSVLNGTFHTGKQHFPT